MTPVTALTEEFAPLLPPHFASRLTHSPECGDLSWLQSQHLLLKWLLEVQTQTTDPAPGTAKWQGEGLRGLVKRDFPCLIVRPSLGLGNPLPWLLEL